MNSRASIIFAALVLVGQATLFGLWWKDADISTSDFPALYVTARLWQEGRNPYDLEAQCRVEAGMGRPNCSPFSHPPVLLPLMSAVSDADFVASYWRWAVVQLFVLALCLVPLYLLSRDFTAAGQAALLYPVVVGVWFGNDMVFVLLGVAAWVWLLSTDKDLLAGLALSLTVLKPQLALPLAVPLLFARPKAFAGFCAGGGVLTLLSFALVGTEGFRGIMDITRAMSERQDLGVLQELQFNLTGLLARSGMNTAWAWRFYLLTFIGISLLWRARGVTPANVSLAIILTLFTVPHQHYYDLALLAVPAVLIPRLALSLMALFLVTTTSFTGGFAAAYVLMAALAVYFNVRGTPPPQDEPIHAD